MTMTSRIEAPRASGAGDSGAVDSDRVDAFTAEILRNYLVSTVREMVATTVRTAYSTCFSEGEDFTCALFDARGNMIAQAAGLPVHAGGLPIVVRHFLEVFDPNACGGACPHLRLGFRADERSHFLGAHQELLAVPFWREIQDRIRAGEILDIFPYHDRYRLRPER